MEEGEGNEKEGETGEDKNENCATTAKAKAKANRSAFKSLMCDKCQRIASRGRNTITIR